MGFWQLARLRGADFGVQERKDKSKQITLSATAHKGGAIGGSFLLLLTKARASGPPTDSPPTRPTCHNQAAYSPAEGPGWSAGALM